MHPRRTALVADRDLAFQDVDDVVTHVPVAFDHQLGVARMRRGEIA